MSAVSLVSAAEYKNCSADGSPIVTHQLLIRQGIENNRQFGLRQKLAFKFSKYGKIWHYATPGRHIVFLAYDNEQSRDRAVQNENGTLFMNKRLTVGPYYSSLHNGIEIIPQKLNHASVDINTLLNCEYYWNKQLYPTHIVEYGLQHGISQIRQSAGRFNVLCYHNTIAHPFVIQMASEKRIQAHIIHVRPQTKLEIGCMLQDADIILLKQVLTNANVFDVDWRNYLVFKGTILSKFAAQDPFPYERVRYMIDIIGCDANHPKYRLLHIAAHRHDMQFINLLLYHYNIHPCIKDTIWSKTALQECNYAWKEYQDKLIRNNHNIIQLPNRNRNMNRDDVKSSLEDVYIKSVLLEHWLYVQNYGNVMFINVAVPFKQFARFSLDYIDGSGSTYIIKVKYGSKSFKRICSLKGYTNLACDIVLTADVNNKTVAFLPREKDTNVSLQHWGIHKAVQGNEAAYVFSVQIKGKQYALGTGNDCKLRLHAMDDNTDQSHSQEGSDFNETIKSWFVIMRKCEFKKKGKYEWTQRDPNLSFLRGDADTCRRIHRNVVQRLEGAMKIQKLYGDTKGNDNVNRNEEKQEEVSRHDTRKKVYQPKKVIHKYRTPSGYNTLNSKRCHGVCKRWYTKGFGFIKMNDGSNNDLFVHRNEIKSGNQSVLYVGDSVEFDIEMQTDGRRKAVNVIVTS